MNYLEFKEKYKIITKVTAEESNKSTDHNDQYLLFYSNSYTRIFFVLESSNKIILTLELHPSKILIDEELNNLNEEEIQENLQTLIRKQINLLEYLQVLSKNTFSIDYIIEENIWYANKVLKKEPDEKLFELLQINKL